MTGLGGAFRMLAFSGRLLPASTGGRRSLVIVALIAGGIPPEHLLLAAPYLFSLALLAVPRGTSLEPAALGVPIGVDNCQEPDP